jgi:hypothetical protein
LGDRVAAGDIGLDRCRRLPRAARDPEDDDGRNGHGEAGDDDPFHGRPAGLVPGEQRHATRHARLRRSTPRRLRIVTPHNRHSISMHRFRDVSFMES